MSFVSCGVCTPSSIKGLSIAGIDGEPPVQPQTQFVADAAPVPLPPTGQPCEVGVPPTPLQVERLNDLLKFVQRDQSIYSTHPNLHGKEIK